MTFVPALTTRSGNTQDDQQSGQLVAGPLGGGNDGIGCRTEDDPNLVVPTVSATLGGRRGHDEQASYVSVGHGGIVSPEDDRNQILGMGEFKFPRLSESNVGVGESLFFATVETDAVDELGHKGDSPKPAPFVKGTGVRRLTPIECERLQGFPDGWTDLGGTPDSKRYAALGDAVTVNVAYWIGLRLMAHVQAVAA